MEPEPTTLPQSDTLFTISLPAGTLVTWSGQDQGDLVGAPRFQDARPAVQPLVWEI